MGFDFTRRQWMTLVAMSIADFCNAICVSLQAPFYPQEAERKGCSATEYGLVFGIFELVVFLVSPLYGAHLNKLGPKLLFNGGILTTGTCAVLFGLLDKVDGHIPFIALSFIIRIVEAMGNAAFLTASFAIIAKEFPNNVATMFASLETCFGLGLIAGPMVGGALYSFGGYTTPFAIMGAVLFTAAIMSYFALPVHDDVDDDTESTASMLSLLKIPGVLLAALSIIITSTSIGFLQATLEPHLRQFGFSPVVLGLMFIINGGIYAITAPGWGWACDHRGFNPKWITVLGCIFVACAFLLIGPVPFIAKNTAVWVCIIGLVLHGLGMSCQLVASFTDALKTAMSHCPCLSDVLSSAPGEVCKVGADTDHLVKNDGTIDTSVINGNGLLKSAKSQMAISIEQSRPSGMNSLIACNSFKNRRNAWRKDGGRYCRSYGSLETDRYRQP